MFSCDRFFIYFFQFMKKINLLFELSIKNNYIFYIMYGFYIESQWSKSGYLFARFAFFAC